MAFLCKSGFTLGFSFSLVFSASQRILYKDVKCIYFAINREVAVSILFIKFEISQIIHIVLTRLYYINIEICWKVCIAFLPLDGTLKFN